MPVTVMLLDISGIVCISHGLISASMFCREGAILNGPTLLLEERR